MGERLLSLRGADGRWRGVTTQNVADRGERRFLRIENGYVSPDGSEIRQWPGSFTLLDLSQENNLLGGYDRYITDAVLPLFQTTPSATYQFEAVPPLANRQSLIARARRQHLHCFEQVGDQLLIIGESRFRECPINDAARVQLSIVAVTDVGGFIRLTLSGSPSAHTADDSSAGLNGLTQYQVVYVENAVGVDGTDPAEQALLDAKLNRKVHEVTAISGTLVTLATTALGLGAPLSLLTGEIHVVRFNRSDSYSADGTSPYAEDIEDRIDDPTALTSWRVIDVPAKGDSVKPCFPAWVANRQRDFGDTREAVAPIEGVWTDAFGRRGSSRREQLELPYRVNPEPATDRLILAAPGYGCMFQVPVKIPADPDGELGIDFTANDVHDKPRALGVPKARVIECSSKTPPTDPTEFNTVGFDFNVFPIVGTPSDGLPAGTYKFAVSYEDEATGEEGLASETVEVEIPSNSHAYTILIPYFHPGYIMPECLALKLNVYLALPGEDNLAFYASFPLQWRPIVSATVNNTNGDLSGKYGFTPSEDPGGAVLLWRTIRLPMPGATNDLTAQLNPQQAAPQSAAMPRGADAVRYVRGVMLSGGNLGNQGPALQLWESKASSQFAGILDDADVMLIRTHGASAEVPNAGMDGDLTTHALGVAGRCFPNAYQGIEMVHRDLLPTRSRLRIDRVLNRLNAQLTGGAFPELHNQERIRLTRSVFDRIREAGTATSVTSISRQEKDVWYVEPIGQLQVADPGAPNRSSPSFIQFLDPSRGRDVTAIGNLAGRGIVCTRNETYTFTWFRNPSSELPQLLHNEFGCVAANSMVEFDGGLAWVSERGPVAIGGRGIQHVGQDVEAWFQGRERRYRTDRRGMMRHCWGAHDAQRGLVLWGMVTREATHEVEREFVSYSFDDASDELRSRFPCDEVLIWSYRANAFSTWRPPAGREIVWMRPLRTADGRVWMCHLAADGRIYGLDDAGHDTTHAEVSIEATLTTKGVATTTLSFTTANAGMTTATDGFTPSGRDGEVTHVRSGLAVEFVNTKGELYFTTTITGVDSSGTTTALFLAAAASWDAGTVVRIGPRQRMTLVSTFLGAEAKGKLNVSDLQLRYTLGGQGTANFIASLLKTDRNRDDAQAAEVALSDPSLWTPLGRSLAAQDDDGYRSSHRRATGKGGAAGPETAVKIVFTGAAQVRLSDVALEVA